MRICVRFISFILATIFGASCEFALAPEKILHTESYVLSVHNATETRFWLECYLNPFYEVKCCDMFYMKSSFTIHCDFIRFYIDDKGNKVLRCDGVTSCGFNEDYCRNFLDELYDDSYIRILSEDGELLREWRKGDVALDEKSPFNSDSYRYKFAGYGDSLEHEWRFVISEDMLQN